jgi:lambda family phage tail tape measure protein
MAIISRLAVLLGLDAGEFNANLGKAKDKVEGFSTGAKVSLLAVGTAFAASAREAINFADKINDVAKANDMSVQSVLRMSQALSTNGGNADDAGKLMASFANKVDEAAQGGAKAQKAFLSVGVSLKDLRTLSPDELFQKTIKSLAGVEDSMKRNALATDMFGRAIRGVDIKGMADEFEKIKGKFAGSEEAFKSIGNSVDRLDRFFLNLKVTLATRVAPAFEYVTQAMEDWQKRGQGIVDRFAQVRKEAGWWAAWKDKEGFQKYEFAERGSVQGANVPSIMSGIGGVAGPKKDKREVIEAIDKEAQAEAKKAKEALQRQQEFYEKEMLITQAKNDRLQKEYELAFVSENERKLQLEIYDIEQKRKQLTLGDQFGRKMTEEQANLWAEAEKARAREAYAVAQQQRDFEYGWKKAFASYADNANNAAKQAEQSFVNLSQALEDTLTKFFETGKIDFRSFITSILHEIARLQAQKAAASILGLFGGGGGIGDFIGGLFKGGASPAFGSTAFWGGKAEGGNVNSSNSYMVGERGPELFVPKGAGTIIPNNQLGSAMGGQPQVVYNGPYIANMSAIDTQSGLQFLAKNKQGVWAANQSAQRSLPQSR